MRSMRQFWWIQQPYIVFYGWQLPSSVSISFHFIFLVLFWLQHMKTLLSNIYKFYVLDSTDNIIFTKNINISLIKIIFENHYFRWAKASIFRKTFCFFSGSSCLFLDPPYIVSFPHFYLLWQAERLLSMSFS